MAQSTGKKRALGLVPEPSAATKNAAERESGGVNRIETGANQGVTE
jgi:hypothetical protein